MTIPSTGPKRIRVLVADDSAFMRTALTRMIESDPLLEVVATAANGIEALEQVVRHDPDVITLDLEMPRLDGLGVLRRLMAESPRPVIVVSSLTKEGAEATFEAFDLGAFECIPKQLSYAHLDIVKIRDLLVEKVKAAAAASARLRRPQKKLPPVSLEPAGMAEEFTTIRAPEVVVIGTSTGGPPALQRILPELPADLPVGVLIVQHMPPGFTGPFARRLDSFCQVRVREATNGDVVEPAQVLIAPAGRQMTIGRISTSKHVVRVSNTPADTLHKPSVDVLMLSVAEVAGASSMGVILTGMGRDGADGMKAIFEKGGLTVGQDEASCVVYGMPMICAQMGVLKHILPLERIPGAILSAVRYGR